jgi:uncharacterized protein
MLTRWWADARLNAVSTASPRFLTAYRTHFRRHTRSGVARNDHRSNTTRNVILAERASVARAPWTRLLGLMGRASLPHGGGLVFPGAQGIHTHFMRFPIDVVFYGARNEVVDVIHAMRPWRFSPYRFKAKGVIELPAGTVRGTNTERGDVLGIG